jgi:hypothetical protein
VPAARRQHRVAAPQLERDVIPSFLPRQRWFAGKAPQDLERPAAIKRLLDTGLIEPAPAPQHYRVTADGWEFLQALRARVGGSSGLDWTRVDEIDFSKL